MSSMNCKQFEGMTVSFLLVYSQYLAQMLNKYIGIKDE